MSRTPEYNIDKLPKWVKQVIADRTDEVNRLILENERLTDVIAQYEQIDQLSQRNQAEDAALRAWAANTKNVVDL